MLQYRKKLLTFIFLLGFFISSPESCQGNTPSVIVKKTSGTTNYSINLKIPKGWYLYAPDSLSGLPLTFQEKSIDGVTSYSLQWPISQKKVFNNTVTKIYKDHTSIPLQIHKSTSSLLYSLQGNLKGALCKTTCHPFSIDISIESPLYKLSFWFWILLISYFGGLILNIMPCVWPVLFMKLKALSSNHKNHVKKSLITFIGILCFFNILALFSLQLSHVGQKFLWGQHFQNPNFLLFLTIITTLSGIAYFYQKKLFTNFQKLPVALLNISFFKYYSDFFLGFFAGILSSPCTAPFLSTALTFSLTGELGFFIFNAIAIGYGTPYLLVMAFPKIVRHLPKPGKWLTLTEKLTGIILLIMAFWFAYITYESWDTSSKNSYYRSYSPSSYSFPTKPLNIDEITPLIKKGKKVFVITTAPWCITCKYNEYSVLKRKSVAKALSNPNVIVMIGVWKDKNDAVTLYLNKTKSSGIPTYHIYTSKKPHGIKLPEILSVKELLQVLKE